MSRIISKNDPRHGTSNGYGNLNCRCKKCKAAWAAHISIMTANRKKKLKKDPTLVPHGRASTYTNWGCRCKPCTKAANEDRRERKARKRKEALA